MERVCRQRKKKEKPITSEEELAEIVIKFESEEIFPNKQHDVTVTPRRESGKRKISKKYLSDDYQYAKSVFFQQGHSISKKPYGSTCTLEYVHAIREAVESHQQRGDCHPHSVNQATILAQKYNIHKGLKIFGDRGRVAVTKEMKQLDDLEVVKP